MRYLDLDDEDAKLVAAAADVIRRTLREDRHTVGAAVRCSSGKTYVGVNVDSCGYGPCAEPVAVGAAVSAGETTILAVVAVEGRSGQYRVLSPCGNCRQLLLDYAPDAAVIIQGEAGLTKVGVRDLLPYPYRSF
jgi:cytidine deaminase